MAVSEADIAAQLLERLLADPALRARFRRDPAGACREAGLDSLAEEMAPASGKAMLTLDIRESRSSLAGVMMAAAMEGVSAYQFAEHVLPRLDDVPKAVGRVLSRVNLPAIGGGGLGTSPPSSEVPLPETGEEEQAVSGAPGVAAAAEVGPVPRSARDAPEPAAGAKVAAQRSPDVKARKEADEVTAPAVADVPSATDLPSPASAPAPAVPAVADVASPVAAPAPVVPAAPPADPGVFGVEGSGGAPDAAALALLANGNVVLDEVGVADVRAGRVDPRVVAVLASVSREHRITVSSLVSDHGKFTAGGSVSNHFVGRGVDIAAIDGVPVDASNFDARELAMRLQELDPAIRPDEVGTPWAIAGPGYFTDAGHQDHLHIAFDEPIGPDFMPLGDPAAVAAPIVAATGDPAAAAAPPGVVPAADLQAPAVPAANVPPPVVPAAGVPPRPGDSQTFVAVSPAEAAAQAAAAGGGRRGTLSFLKVPDPAAPAAPAVPAAAAVPLVDPAGALGAYPGDDAPQPQLAAWMAAQAQARGIPAELPVMAALVESGLRNLDHGHADSVGFFQMRTSIWNQGEYAGYPDDPGKQLDWFLDQAEAVKAQRQARGQPIDDPNQYGEWIADIERPAEQYRGRYQLQLQTAQALLETTPTAAPDSSAATVPADAAADAVMPAATTGAGPGPRALIAVEEARKYLGTAYKWGGSTPQTGFDCSGLVQWAYAQAGVTIPRVTDQQILAENGAEVGRDQLVAGDLVFFRDSSGYVHHVGMSLGGDEFIHAPHTGDVVKISSLDEPYYAEQFAGGRRFDTANGAPAQLAPAAAPTATDADVAAAQAAVARDAAEVRRHDSALFIAVQAQEARKARNTEQFMKAIDPAASQAVAQAPGRGDLAPGYPADLAAGYPGDNASQMALANWLANEAAGHGLPPELPVMAALVESGLRNLDFGHADSLGFFQMRKSIWDTGEYAGYPNRPQLQIKWFVDQALAVKERAMAAGDVDFGTDPATWGEWIAEIERPLEQYRGRYQLRLEEARGLLAA